MTKAFGIVLIILTPFWALAQRGFFVENKGQLPDNVLFHCKLNYGDFYIEKDGSFKIKVLDPHKVDEIFGHDHSEKLNFKSHSHSKHFSKLIKGHVFKVNFINANFNNSYYFVKKGKFKINIFKGNNPEKWTSGLTPFSEITLEEIYPNINLKVYFKENSIKYDFIVKPFGKRENIRIQYLNLNHINFNKNSIELHTSVGKVTDEYPISYFQSNPSKKIKTTFEKININTFGLKIDYNLNSETIVIDPQLNFASFTGASLDNWGYTATYDDAGYAYGGGISFGGQYPTTLGSFQSVYGAGQIDMSISKFSPDGKSLEYSTYIGGDGLEAPHSMIVNENNELVIYGITSSLNYPVSANAYDKTFNGGNSIDASNVLKFSNGTDIIITKLSQSGNSILGSTYYGGSGNDALNDASNTSMLSFNYADDYRGEVTTDKSNNIYISSVTESSDLPTPNGFQPNYGGGLQDGCIAKFNDDLSSIIWGSYFGGSGADACYASKQNSKGETYITGGTTSDDLSLNGLKTNFSGDIDGFLVRISENGNSILNGTYVGTSSYDQSYFVEVDYEDKVYCFGQSLGNMPVSPGVYSNLNSKQFLHKYNEELNNLEASTTIGSENGTINIVPSALMVSNCKEIYLSGWGGEVNLPMFNTHGMVVTPDAEQSSTDGSDFYFMLLGPDFTSLKYATFFGGSELQEHVDGGTSRFDRKGTIYQAVCAGCGGSSAFPVTPTAFSTNNNAKNCNMAVIKMDISKLNATIKFTRDTNYCEDRPVKLYNESNGGKEYEWIYPDGTKSNSYNGEYVFPDSGNYVVQLVAIDSSHCPYRDTADIDINILIYPKIEFDIDTFICNESALEIKTFGGPVDSNYTWYTKDTVYTEKKEHVLNITIDTTTTFNVSYVNRCGISVNSVKIPRYYVPKGKLNTDTVCEYNDQRYFFPIDIDYNISEINNKPFTHFEDTINFSGPSQQYIIQTTGMCGSARDTFNINRIDIYPKLSNDTILCPGEFATLSVSGGDNYSWDSELIPENRYDSSYSIQVFETNYFPISIYKGSCFKRDSIEIKIYPRPFQEVKDEYTVNFGDEVDFPVNTKFNYSWTPKDYLKNPIRNYFYATPKDDITYYFTYKSEESCNLTDSINIKVIFPLYVPNTFTPNGDGKNEDFGAYSHVLDDYEIHIFDRWGNLAFHSTSLDKRWDGTVNGNDQQEDVYVYKIKYKLRYTNQWKQKIGIVNLIR